MGQRSYLDQDSTTRLLRWDVPASTPAGVYQAQLIVDPTTSINITLVVGPTKPTVAQMTSIRFGAKPQYAQGEVVTLFGSMFSGLISPVPSAANSSQGLPLQTQLAQSQVVIDGTPVPLFFAFTNSSGASQINFQIPYSLVEGPHTLRVNRLLPSGETDASSSDYSFIVRRVSPTYLGSALVGVYVQNLTQGPAGDVFVTGDTPARPGDVATVYATGLGATSPAVNAGSVPPSGTLARVLVPVTVLVRSGASQWVAEVFGAAASPQYPGLYQISFRFPLDTDPGSHPTVDLVLGVGEDVQVFPLNFDVGY
jgi:uncharacterized protein (TIGR03437 family)